MSPKIDSCQSQNDFMSAKCISCRQNFFMSPKIFFMSPKTEFHVAKLISCRRERPLFGWHAYLLIISANISKFGLNITILPVKSSFRENAQFYFCTDFCCAFISLKPSANKRSNKKYIGNLIQQCEIFGNKKPLIKSQFDSQNACMLVCWDSVSLWRSSRALYVKW